MISVAQDMIDGCNWKVHNNWDHCVHMKCSGFNQMNMSASLLPFLMWGIIVPFFNVYHYIILTSKFNILQQKHFYVRYHYAQYIFMRLHSINMPFCSKYSITFLALEYSICCNKVHVPPSLWPFLKLENAFFSSSINKF